MMDGFLLVLFSADHAPLGVPERFETMGSAADEAATSVMLGRLTDGTPVHIALVVPLRGGHQVWIQR